MLCEVGLKMPVNRRPVVTRGDSCRGRMALELVATTAKPNFVGGGGCGGCGG